MKNISDKDKNKKDKFLENIVTRIYLYFSTI